LRGDTVYLVNSRKDRSGRYGIQRFLARTGADVGAIVMKSAALELSADVRFGSSPTDLITFSSYSGIITRFDASRRVPP
jgi:hypothetical protein